MWEHPQKKGITLNGMYSRVADLNKDPAWARKDRVKEEDRRNHVWWDKNIYGEEK